MPLKNGRLTPQERSFADAYALTNNAEFAAHKAGYKSSSALAKASDDALQARIHAARQRLRTEGAEIGVGVLIELAQDKATPSGVRRAAASDLVKLSGVGASEGEAEKPLSEMSAAELATLADRMAQRRDMLLKAASDKAKPVLEVEPSEGLFD